MSEHQKETAFLRRCLRWGGGAEHLALDRTISRIQREERLVARAVWIMAGLAALAAAGLGYSSVLVENFPQDMSRLVVKSDAALGLSSILCVIVFMVIRKVYRLKLNERRDECRRLITNLLEARLREPAPTHRHELLLNEEAQRAA